MKNNRKMKNRKTKTKNYYSTNNEKLQEKSREYYKNLSEDEKIKKNKKKIKKGSMLKTEEKTTQMKLEEEKGNIWEIITTKNVLNHLIKELENVTANK